jgi:hypothetical protein
MNEQIHLCNVMYPCNKRGQSLKYSMIGMNLKVIILSKRTNEDTLYDYMSMYMYIHIDIHARLQAYTYVNRDMHTCQFYKAQTTIEESILLDT